MVSFSARVQAEETSTLGLLEQDFAVMGKYCEQYGGSVLKSTGDGLLLYFSSAVHSVKCAMKIQRHFAERAKANPGGNALIHRIGVHLGDVFATGQDVMGDGVNIAARLQAVADPGGVCISQTVYDVVRNKLKLQVERLTPRDLRNISEIGPLYRVVLEPRKANPAPATFAPPAPAPRTIFSRTERLVIFGLLALGLAAVGRLIFQADSRQKEVLADSQAKQAELAENVLLTEIKAGTPDPSAPAGAGAPASGRPEDANFAELGAEPPQPKETGQRSRMR